MASDHTSSPDPLTSDHPDVISLNSPSKSSSSHIGRSPNRHRKVSTIQSPSRVMTEQIISPWRIKVIVEAEPEEGEENVARAGRKTRTVTHTMKIPLQSERNTSPTRTRKSSPAPRRKSRRKSVTDLDVVILGDDAEEDEWSAHSKSPRKRRGSRTKAARRSSPDTEEHAADSFPILEDEVSGVVNEEENSHNHKDCSPELKQIDLNQVALRARKTSTNDKEHTQNSKQDIISTRIASTQSVISYPTPSPTASERGDSDQIPHEEDAVDQEVGLHTIMESEGFTMIDLESLPAIKNLRSSPLYADEISTAMKPVRAGLQKEDGTNVENRTTSVHNSIVSADDTDDMSQLASSPPSQLHGTGSKLYSIGHLQLPSSLRIHRHRHVTPLPVTSEIMSSSPPPLPRSMPVVRNTTTIPKTAVEAGLALQDAVTPEPELTSKPRSGQIAHRPEDDTIFGGFSSETRRELRAELRFGEELGTKTVCQNRSAEAISASAASHLPSALPTHESTGNASELSDVQNEVTLQQKWQKKREEVIRQANRPGAAQAVMIESDDEEIDQQDDCICGNETTGDIWLAEAKDASSSPKCAEQTESRSQPKRKLIPSPWKRGKNIVDNASTYLSIDDSVSGLMWRSGGKDGNVRFGDGILAHPDKYDLKTEPRNEVGENQIVCWRSAQDVADEDTDLFEQAKELAKPNQQQEATADESITNLYETNLDALPEQDLLSPSNTESDNHPQAETIDHDSTYSSISDADSITQQYKQRTSLSPSKHRPNTPRSALKGGRVSFGQSLRFDIPDDEKKRVVWAKKAACVNELWEESSRSIRSTQDSSIDETPTPIVEDKSAQVDDGVPVVPVSTVVNNCDGAIDGFANHDVPSDLIVPPYVELSEARSQTMKSSQTSRSHSPEFHEIQSYLKPPSYPTVPDRDITKPLAATGEFSTTHFRTMHILYRKSQRPRFHAPQYPSEVRQEIRALVESDWKLIVDESESMGERFTFRIGVAHARVIERFMQEIEWDWQRQGEDVADVEWGWSAEQLATWLGRIIVGEAVRADEKAAMSEAN